MMMMMMDYLCRTKTCTFPWTVGMGLDLGLNLGPDWLGLALFALHQ